MIDIETTGLDPSRHAMVEFAAVSLAASTVRLIGAGRGDLVPALRAAASELQDEATVVVAHNLDFDLGFLAAFPDTPPELSAPSRWLCTLLAGDERRTLDALAARAGVRVQARHTAEGDARTLAAVLAAATTFAAVGATVADALAPITGRAWLGVNVGDWRTLLTSLRDSLDHVVPCRMPSRAQRDAFRATIYRLRGGSGLPSDLEQRAAMLGGAGITTAVFDVLLEELAVETDT